MTLFYLKPTSAGYGFFILAPDLTAAKDSLFARISNENDENYFSYQAIAEELKQWISGEAELNNDNWTLTEFNPGDVIITDVV